MNDYYTYAYLREDGTPYYVGKGRNGRAFSNSRRTFKCPLDKARVLFLKRNLSEAEAFKHECYMIAVLGRKDLGKGILHNKTDGGEGLSGLVITEKHRANLCKAAAKKKPRTKASIEKGRAKLLGRKQSPTHVKNNGIAHRIAVVLEHTGTHEVRAFSSGKEAAKALDLHEPSISALRKGKLLTHKGWRIKNDNQ